MTWIAVWFAMFGIWPFLGHPDHEFTGLGAVDLIVHWVAIGYLVWVGYRWARRNRDRTIGDIIDRRYWCRCGDEAERSDPYWKKHRRCANCGAANGLEIN